MPRSAADDCRFAVPDRVGLSVDIDEEVPHVADADHLIVALGTTRADNRQSA